MSSQPLSWKVLHGAGFGAFILHQVTQEELKECFPNLENFCILPIQCRSGQLGLGPEAFHAPPPGNRASLRRGGCQRIKALKRKTWQRLRTSEGVGVGHGSQG